MTVFKTVLFPSFSNIIERAKDKMAQSFGKYGNSWVNFYDWKFWNERLETEWHEYKTSQSREERQEEILDMINILSMMYENIGWEQGK